VIWQGSTEATRSLYHSSHTAVDEMGFATKRLSGKIGSGEVLPSAIACISAFRPSWACFVYSSLSIFPRQARSDGSIKPKRCHLSYASDASTWTLDLSRQNSCPDLTVSPTPWDLCSTFQVDNRFAISVSWWSSHYLQLGNSCPQ
jgi:hypothetical protein